MLVKSIKCFILIFFLLFLNFSPIYAVGGSSGGGGAGCSYDSGGGDTCGGVNIQANNDYYDFTTSASSVDQSLQILSNDSCKTTQEVSTFDSGGNAITELIESDCLQDASLIITILTSPDMGTATVFGRYIQYLVDTTNFVDGITTDTFTYEICSHGNCSQAIVEVDITKNVPNQEIIANNDQYNINISSNAPSSNSFTMEVLSNDVYPNNFSGCSLTIDSQPSSGSVTKSGNNLIFTYEKIIVAPGVPEQFSFNYTISCDSVSDSARVDLNISADPPESPPPDPPESPPPDPPQGDCDLCILFLNFNASLGDIKATLEAKLGEISFNIGQIALNLTYINNKITENTTNPPPPPPGDSGGDPPSPPPTPTPTPTPTSQSLPCNPLPASYKGGYLAPIADASGVIKPWCEYRQIIVCPENLFEIDNFASIIFGENGLKNKFPMDIVGNFPSSAGSSELIVWIGTKKFNLSWWLNYMNIIKIPCWVAFMVWVLVRL